MKLDTSMKLNKIVPESMVWIERSSIRKAYDKTGLICYRSM